MLTKLNQTQKWYLWLILLKIFSQTQTSQKCIKMETIHIYWDHLKSYFAYLLKGIVAKMAHICAGSIRFVFQFNIFIYETQWNSLVPSKHIKEIRASVDNLYLIISITEYILLLISLNIWESFFVWVCV